MVVSAIVVGVAVVGGPSLRSAAGALAGRAGALLGPVAALPFLPAAALPVGLLPAAAFLALAGLPGRLLLAAAFLFLPAALGFALLLAALLLLALAALGGFFLAAALGTLLAALAARFKRVEEWLAPPVLAMKTVPVASFVILALIWFGSRNLSVFIALVMVFPVIYTNVLAGVRAADRDLAEMARVFRIPLLRRIRCIALPQVAPYFRAGCALGLGLCWKAGVAAEVIGMPVPSIGERLQQAKVYLDTPELFAWTLVIVLISVGFEKLFMAALGALERRLTRL